MKFKSTLFLVILCVTFAATGQIKIGDNPQNIDASSVLELESPSRVLVITRVNTAQMNNIVPLAGALVFNTDLQCVHYYDGIEWINLCDSQTFTTEAIINVNETIVITPDEDAASSNFEIAKNAIRSDNITVGGVNTGNIQDGTILGNDIQAGAITNANLSEAAVNSIKIADQSIQTVDIAPGATNEVLTSNGTAAVWQRLTGLNIVGEDLVNTDASIEVLNGAGSVLFNTTISVADDGITTSKIANNAVNNSKLANGAVQNENMTPDAVTTAEIQDRTIIPNDFADGVTAGEVFQWDGTDWVLVEVSALSVTEVDGVIGNEIFDATAGGSLERSGAGTDLDRYTLDVRNGGISTDELDTDAVTTVKILDANVTDDKLDKVNISLTGFGVPTANLSLAGFGLNNVLEPVAAQDAATKNYVDNAINGTNTLNDADIFVGSATNVATSVTLSGDATIDNTGILTISDDAVTTVKILDANVTDDKLDKANISLTGFGVPTANLSLAGFGLNNVLEPVAAQDAATKNYVDNAINGTNTLNDADIFVGSATNEATSVTLSGDATIDNNGVLTISDDAVTTTKILDDAVTIDKIGATLADAGRFLITNALTGEPTWVDPIAFIDGTSIDISGFGQLQVADDGITSTKIDDETILNIDVAATAAIDGTKINPNFGTQNIVTTGTLTSANATITGTLSTTGIATIGANNITATDGTIGQVLTTDGAGNAAWEDTAPVAIETTAAFDGDGLVATPLDLADDAVTTIKIANDAVDASKIAADVAGNGLQQNSTTGALEIDPSNATNLATTNLIQTAGSNRTYDIDVTSNLIFTGGGNVGIGNGANPPSNKLHVAGAIRAQGVRNSFGTNTSVAYSFNNDSNTGINRTAADELTLVVGGIQALVIADEGTTDSELIVNGSLELTEQVLDENGNTGNVGDILIATTTGTEWSEPSIIAMGKANGGNSINVNGATVSGSALAGTISVNFLTPRPDQDYIIQLTVRGDNKIFVTGQSNNNFNLEIRRNSDNALVVAEWFFTITDF